jgi:hypothetical protein
MFQNRLLFIVALASLACTGCFMGPVANNQVTSSLSLSQAKCQMTVQNDSFAGLCAQIQISNTGAEAMAGWEIDFDLPPSSHLQNSWNANFVLQGQHVVVTPLAAQGNLDVGASVMLGYCATETGTNIVASPGSCDGGQGTAITQNTDENVTPTQVTNATKVVVAGAGWQVLEGNIAGAPCRFTAQATQPEAASISLAFVPQTDATLACGALVSPCAQAFDGVEVAVAAAAQSGMVTSIGQTIHNDTGLQGLVLQLGAADPAHVMLTLWHNGIAKRITLDTPDSLTDGTHLYGWSWGNAGLRVVVDEMVLYSQPDPIATGLQAPRWVSVTPGHPKDTAFAL